MVAYSFKWQFVGPIRAGLGIDHMNERGKIVIPGPRPKRQTIRAIGKRRHARPGETLQLYYGLRTKQCMSIGVARCTDVLPVTLRVCNDGDLIVSLNRRMVPEAAVEEFAKNDGFGSVEDMWLFWRREHPGIEYFNGVLIKWEPIA